jgi:hypothetical protein
MPSRECRLEFDAARVIRRRTPDAARYARRWDRVLSIVGEGEIWAICTDRQQGDIRDSGRPAAARTDKFRAKPVRKTTSGALAIMNFT